MEVLERYPLVSDGVLAEVVITRVSDENVPVYDLKVPHVAPGAKALLQGLAERLVQKVPFDTMVADQQALDVLKKQFLADAREAVSEAFGDVSEEQLALFSGMLLHSLLGLGDIELFLADSFLEEIAVNSAKYPLTVFHKKYGWLKTTFVFSSEEEVYALASQIGRKVGRQITTLTPLMDAHLLTGDRVAASLFPVSAQGNTITIRKFARNPWTVVRLIQNETVSKEVVAFLWLSLQYEANVLVAGGTATGKTSFLNALSILIPPSQRVISIEDTREIALSRPQCWNWVPLSSQAANPEGQGKVEMLDLLVASLRMRPDRIVVGEVRRREQVETMFEAMHTGHAVYTTMHADTAEQTMRRLLEPPFSLPQNEVEVLDLIVVQHRDRRKNVRKTLEVAEVLRTGTGSGLKVNYLYRWRPRKDAFEKGEGSVRMLEMFALHGGLTPEDVARDLEEKEMVLQWMIEKGVVDVEEIGKVMELYYRDSAAVVAAAVKGLSFIELFPS